MEKTDKILIFISSKKHLSKLNKIIKGHNKNTVLVIGDDLCVEDIPADLRNSTQCKDFGEYETQEHSALVCADQAWKSLKTWGDLKIDDEKTLDNLTQHKKISLWKVYDTGIILYYLSDLIYYIKVVKAVLQEEKPSQLILVGTGRERVENIFFELAKQSNILITQWYKEKVIRLFLPGFPIALERSFLLGSFEIRLCLPFWPYIYAIFLKTAITGILGRVYNSKFKFNSRKKHKDILYYSHNKKSLDSVLALMNQPEKDIRNRLLFIDWFWRDSDSIKLLKEEKIPHRVFDGYITWGIIKSLPRRANNFLCNWRLIEENISFQGLLKYDGFCLWNLINGYLKELFLRTFIKMSIFFEVANEVLDKEKPKLILVTNEREHSARLSILAAKFKDVPSLGLQRGAFTDYADMNPPLYTDKLVVDGEFAYKVLTKRGIAPKKLIIAGNPRYDFIKRMDLCLAKEKVYKKLGLKMDKKLLLFTSMFVSPTYHLKDKRRAVQAIFSSAKKFPDCCLVVKLHPKELDVQLHRSIAKRVGIENILIVKDMNIFELIASCRVLITNYSTTGIEGILMDKPLVFVNLSKAQPDWIPYADSGAAIKADKEEDIESALKDILNNNIAEEKLKIGRENFIREHVFGFDGQAGKRISEIIANIINQSKYS